MAAMHEIDYKIFGDGSPLPLSRLADRIIAAVPRIGRGGREEGSVLGVIGGMLDGDNS